MAQVHKNDIQSSVKRPTSGIAREFRRCGAGKEVPAGTAKGAKLLSVVTVNYNGKQYLSKLLGSLVDQTFGEYEIIIVDNASSDDSVAFVRQNFPTCRVIQLGQNLGFAVGNNIGVDAAEGNLVLLMNNDTWVERDFLQRLVGFYHKNNYDVVAPYEGTYDGEKKEPYITGVDPLGHPVYLKKVNERHVGFYLSGTSLLFTKELYKKTGGFDENFFMYYEDIDWFWRLNLLGKSFSYASDVFVYHKGSGTAGKGIKCSIFLWRNQNALQMLIKNYSWFNLLWVLPAYFIQNIVEILFFLAILKPKIIYSHIQGWVFNIKNLRSTIEKRTWVQKNRVNPDSYILSKMYVGPARLRSILHVISSMRKNPTPHSPFPAIKVRKTKRK